MIAIALRKYARTASRRIFVGFPPSKIRAADVLAYFVSDCSVVAGRNGQKNNTRVGASMMAMLGQDCHQHRHLVCQSETSGFQGWSSKVESVIPNRGWSAHDLRQLLPILHEFLRLLEVVFRVLEQVLGFLAGIFSKHDRRVFKEKHPVTGGQCKRVVHFIWGGHDLFQDHCHFVLPEIGDELTFERRVLLTEHFSWGRHVSSSGLGLFQMKLAPLCHKIVNFAI